MPSRAAVLHQRASTTLRLPPGFERAVLDRVASGRYESVEDVLTACLEALSQVEEFQDEELDWLRKHVGDGLADADRGDATPGDETFRGEPRRRAWGGGEPHERVSLDLPADRFRELTDRAGPRE